MKEVWVTIEETLSKTVKINVPDDIKAPLEYAEDKAKEMYKNEEIVLTADDFDGCRAVTVEDEYGHTYSTNWFD